jgi:uncharacterized protein (DUF433 family)
MKKNLPELLSEMEERVRKIKAERITINPLVMGGKPCIRGLRVTVGMIVDLVASGHRRKEILMLYPYLEDQDITEALAFVAAQTSRPTRPTMKIIQIAVVPSETSLDRIYALTDSGEVYRLCVGSPGGWQKMPGLETEPRHEDMTGLGPPEQDG